MLKETLDDMPRPRIKSLPQVSSAEGREHNSAELQQCRDVFFRDVFPVCALSPAALGSVLPLGQ